jgi:hypothetical protein
MFMKTSAWMADLSNAACPSSGWAIGGSLPIATC